MADDNEVARARALAPDGHAADDDRDALDELSDAGDVAAILELAKQYRSGAGDVPRDLARCLACYQAAAALGSAEAEYAVALFHLSGGVVPQNLKEGAARLRVAADGGYLQAKVYLANLYELGVHYSRDAAKADVWYRSAARAAGVTATPGSPEHTIAMAEIGAARFALLLENDPTIPEGDRARYLRKARASGYQLRVKDDAAAPIAQPVATARATAPTAARATTPTAAATPAPRAAAKPATKPAVAVTEPDDAPEDGDDADEAPVAKPKKTPASKATRTGATSLGSSLAAFVYATIFFAAAVGAGYLAMHGAEELHARTGTLPVFGDHLALVFPSFVFALGVLPTLLVYRARSVVWALVVGGIAWWIGFAAWTRFPFIHVRTMEALGAAICGFLATLLVLGLAGGAKKVGPASRR